MQQCLELAKKGLGNVAPNPMVGCVIVHNEKIIGEGYHQKYGEAHAEVNAINSVKDKSLLSKATLYVNLEPCSHFGKTPPCSDLILATKIPYVVIGCVDSNTKVKGKGIEKLIKAGIDVKVGILEKESRELNKRFFTFQEKKRPYIILKWAQTKDGFIDKKRKLNDGEKPLQISSLESKKLSHKWRAEEQAIMVGTNTAMLDNPSLTARLWEGKNPTRVVIDRSLKIPADYNLFDNKSQTLIFNEQKNEVNEKNEFIKISFSANVLKQIIEELYKREISSVIVEGGSILINSFIKENLWDEAIVIESSIEIKQGVQVPNIIGTHTEEKVGGNTIKIFSNPNTI